MSPQRSHLSARSTGSGRVAPPHATAETVVIVPGRQMKRCTQQYAVHHRKQRTEHAHVFKSKAGRGGDILPRGGDEIAAGSLRKGVAR